MIAIGPSAFSAAGSESRAMSSRPESEPVTIESAWPR